MIPGDIWDLAAEEGVLTPLQLETLQMRERHGMTWNQIAYKMDSDQSTVRGNYNRAVRRLFIELEARNQETT